jgi:hypothetical protein
MPPAIHPDAAGSPTPIRRQPHPEVAEGHRKSVSKTCRLLPIRHAGTLRTAALPWL